MQRAYSKVSPFLRKSADRHTDTQTYLIYTLASFLYCLDNDKHRCTYRPTIFNGENFCWTQNVHNGSSRTMTFWYLCDHSWKQMMIMKNRFFFKNTSSFLTILCAKLSSEFIKKYIHLNDGVTISFYFIVLRH